MAYPSCFSRTTSILRRYFSLNKPFSRGRTVNFEVKWKNREAYSFGVCQEIAVNYRVSLHTFYFLSIRLTISVSIDAKATKPSKKISIGLNGIILRDCQG